MIRTVALITVAASLACGSNVETPTPRPTDAAVIVESPSEQQPNPSPTPGRTCSCSTNPESTPVSCETQTLSDQTKLYWQFDCKTAWLTMESPNGKKIILSSIGADLYHYSFRLGFHLMREYPKSLLFRGGCPATGECIYTLIDKTTGQAIKEFDGVIVDDREKYEFDFIVYISKAKELVVYYVENGKTVRGPITDELTMVYPQWHFGDLTVEGDQLSLTYQNANKFLNDKAVDRGEKIITIDIGSLKPKE